MKYFLSKQIFIDGELYGFQVPSSEPMSETQVKHFLYDRSGDIELHGVDCTDDQVADLLAIQDSRCEVSEITFEEATATLSVCRAYQEIDQHTVSAIRSRYDINRELSIIKLGSADAQYVEMQEYINACRAEGTDQKIAMGLKLSV
ncbi:MAG: hypothetical protein WCR01_15395 [Bacteroidota bacterium]